METKLYIGNMAYNTTEQQLRTMFSEAGTVAAVDVIMDRQTGRPKGFAFVTMGSELEAEKAISLFNEKTVNDRPLKVNIAKPRVETGRVFNEVRGFRSTKVEIGQTNNDLPGDAVVKPEIGRVSNEEPGIRTTQQEIGQTNNEKTS